MWKSHQQMLFMWISVAVMGIFFLLGIWDGEGTPAFIVGQVAIGCLGVLRELHLKKHGFTK